MPGLLSLRNGVQRTNENIEAVQKQLDKVEKRLLRSAQQSRTRQSHARKYVKLQQHLEHYRASLLIGGMLPAPVGGGEADSTEIDFTREMYSEIPAIGQKRYKLTPDDDSARMEPKDFLTRSTTAIKQLVWDVMQHEPAIRFSIALSAYYTNEKDHDETLNHFQSSAYHLENFNDVDARLLSVYNQLMNKIKDWRGSVKSGAVYDRVDKLEICTTRYHDNSMWLIRPMGLMVRQAPGAGHIKCPKWLQGVRSIQNNDERCFMYSVEYALNLQGYNRHPPGADSVVRWTRASDVKDISNYERHLTWLNREKKGKFVYDWNKVLAGTEIQVPVVPRKDVMEKLQTLLSLNIYIWGVEASSQERSFIKIFKPTYNCMVQHPDRPTIHLVYLVEKTREDEHAHFAVVTDLSKMLCDQSKKKRGYFCEQCCSRFPKEIQLKCHQKNGVCRANPAFTHSPQVVLPKSKTLASMWHFRSHSKQSFNPYVIYADWECANETIHGLKDFTKAEILAEVNTRIKLINKRAVSTDDTTESLLKERTIESIPDLKTPQERYKYLQKFGMSWKKHALAKQYPISFSLSLVCSFDDKFNKTLVSVDGDDVCKNYSIIETFAHTLQKWKRECHAHRLRNHDSIIRKTPEQELQHVAAENCMYCGLKFDPSHAHLGVLITKETLLKSTDDLQRNPRKKRKIETPVGESDEQQNYWQKVADHDHAIKDPSRANYRGAACSHCNLQINDGVRTRSEDDGGGRYVDEKYFVIPVIFHNLKHYDGHLVMQAIGSTDSPIDTMEKANVERMKVIPTSGDKFMSITWNGLQFLDSLTHFMCSLEKAVDTLVGIKEPKKRSTKLERESISLQNNNKLTEVAKRVLDGTSVEFKHLSNQMPSLAKRFGVEIMTIDHVKLLLSKGVFWYDWLTSVDQLKSTRCLPTAQQGASVLKNTEQLSEQDMVQAQQVWNLFNMETMYDYLYLYNWLDTVLLACVFEDRRKATYDTYKLDSSKYVSLPSLAVDCCLKSLKHRTFQTSDGKMYTTPFYLELFHEDENETMMDTLQFAESMKRGGISTVKTRFAQSIKGKQEIVYLDANSLYAAAMKYSLPIGNYRWLSGEEQPSPEEFVKWLSDWDEDGPIGYSGTIDVHMPSEYHNYWRDYPLFAENRKVGILELSLEQLQALAEHGEKTGTSMPTDKIIETAPFESEAYQVSMLHPTWNDFLKARTEARPTLYPMGVRGVWEYITEQIEDKTTDNMGSYLTWRNQLIQRAQDRRDWLAEWGASHDEDNGKLMLTLTDKYKYHDHFRYVKWALLHNPSAIVITRVHRILQFEQSPFLDDFVTGNMEKRANPTLSDTIKTVLKLINNALYGKTMQNDREHRNVEAIRSPYLHSYRAGQDNYLKSRQVGNTYLVEMQRRKITINKPILVGATIMSISKWIMVRNWYEVLKKAFPDSEKGWDGQRRLSLLLTDTDSFCVLIKAPAAPVGGGEEWCWQQEMVDKNMWHLIDASSYDKNHKYYSDAQRGRPGLLKDEGEGHWIETEIGIRSKMYALVYGEEELDDGRILRDEKLTSKGLSIKQPLISHDPEDGTRLRAEHYRRCITERDYRAPRIMQTLLGSDGGNINHLYQLTKSTLNPCDSKNYALPPLHDGCHSTLTIPFGFQGVVVE